MKENHIIQYQPLTIEAAQKLTSRLVEQRIQFSFVVNEGDILISCPDTHRASLVKAEPI